MGKGLKGIPGKSKMHVQNHRHKHSTACLPHHERSIWLLNKACETLQWGAGIGELEEAGHGMPGILQAMLESFHCS